MVTKLLTSSYCMFSEASLILVALFPSLLVNFFFTLSFFLAFSTDSAETSIAEDMSPMRFARSSAPPPGVAPSLDVEGCIFPDSVRLLPGRPLLFEESFPTDCLPSVERRLPLPNALSAATVRTEMSFRALLLEGALQKLWGILCCDSLQKRYNPGVRQDAVLLHAPQKV